MNWINSKSLLCRAEFIFRGKCSVCRPGVASSPDWLYYDFRRGQLLSQRHRLQEQRMRHTWSLQPFVVLLSQGLSLLCSWLSWNKSAVLSLAVSFTKTELGNREQRDSSMPYHDLIYQIIVLWYGTGWPWLEIFGILSKDYFSFPPIAVLSFLYPWNSLLMYCMSVVMVCMCARMHVCL